MADTTLPPAQVLSLLNLSPKTIRAMPSAWQRSFSQAIFNWITRYQAAPDAPKLAQIQEYLEAFALLCELEAWEQAIALLTLRLNTPTPTELHQQLFIWGYYREQIQLYERLLNRGDYLLDLTCLNGLGNAWDQLGNYTQAIVYHQQCLTLAQQIHHPIATGNALCNLGNAHFSLQHHAEANHYYTQYLKLIQQANDTFPNDQLDPSAEGKALGNLGNLYRLQGEYSKALETLLKRLCIAQARGDRLGEASAWGNLGTVYLGIQETEQAIACQHRSLAIAQEIGHQAGVGRAFGNLGILFQTIGELFQAIECYESLYAISDDIGDREAQQLAICQLGKLYLNQGNYPKAIEFQKQELIIASAKADWVTVGALQLNLATASRQLNHHSEALTQYEALLVLCKTKLQSEPEKPVLQAMALYGMATLHQKLGDVERAVECCNRVLNLRSESIQPIVERCRSLGQTLLSPR